MRQGEKGSSLREEHECSSRGEEKDKEGRTTTWTLIGRLKEMMANFVKTDYLKLVPPRSRARNLPTSSPKRTYIRSSVYLSTEYNLKICMCL